MDQHHKWKRAIAEELGALLGIPRLQAWKAVNAVFYSMKGALLRGEEVRVDGLGIFRWHSTATNPHLCQYRGLTNLPRRNRVIFKPSEALRRYIAQ